MNSSFLKYSFKIWLITVIVPCVLEIPLHKIYDFYCQCDGWVFKFYMDTFTTRSTMRFIEFFPLLFVLYFSIYFLILRGVDIKKMKIILFSISAFYILGVTSFLFITGTHSTEALIKVLILLAIYLLVSFTSVWIVKFTPIIQGSNDVNP